MVKRFHVSKTAGAAVLFCLYVVVAGLSTDRASSQITQLNGAQTRILTNLQTGNTYTVTMSDCGKLLSLSNSIGMAVTIPQAGASGLNSGCWIDIQNAGAGAVTVTIQGSLVDGATGFSLFSNQGLRLVSNGTAYFTERGQGSGSGGSLAIQSGGVPLGPSSTLNMVAGTGVSCIPQVSGGVMTFQSSGVHFLVRQRRRLYGSLCRHTYRIFRQADIILVCGRKQYVHHSDAQYRHPRRQSDRGR
jgi:hypothetical protein